MDIQTSMVFYRLDTVFENYEPLVIRDHIVEPDLRLEWDGAAFDKLEDIARFPMKT